MQNEIDILFKVGFFSKLDYYFATTLLDIAKETNQIVALTAALVSKNSRNGHICLDINQMANESILHSDFSFDLSGFDKSSDLKQLKFPEKNSWIKALKTSKVVGDNTNFPLVLDSNKKLYLAKYFNYQERIVKNLLQRINYKSPDIDTSSLKNELNNHFNNLDSYSSVQKQGVLKQRKAVQKALQKHFLIISGGPGTGKTYITDKIAKAFKNLSNVSAPAKIIHTAPTGKAASKLKAGLTIHRLLKINTINKSDQNKKSQNIIADFVIIDEASMIDIAIMTKLLEAIPLKAKVVIIGDKNQLGSIEAGSVFSDICQSELLNHYTVNLEYNFRSNTGKRNGIIKLANAINDGNSAKIESLLTGKESIKYNDLSFINLKDISETRQKLNDIIIKGYISCFEEDKLEIVYRKLENFKVLCSHRKSFFGTKSMNNNIEKILQDHPFYDIKHSFLKSVLMITKNDYNKLIFNGDMGMVTEDKGVQKAFFMSEDLTLQSFSLSEIKNYEKAFAITVHKSQGSEFDHVLFIIPPDYSAILTKELIYTAVTRAKKKVTIAGNIDVIKKAVSKKSKKESGMTLLLDKALHEQSTREQ